MKIFENLIFFSTLIKQIFDQVKFDQIFDFPTSNICWVRSLVSSVEC